MTKGLLFKNKLSRREQYPCKVLLEVQYGNVNFSQKTEFLGVSLHSISRSMEEERGSTNLTEVML